MDFFFSTKSMANTKRFHLSYNIFRGLRQTEFPMLYACYIPYMYFFNFRKYIFDRIRRLFFRQMRLFISGFFGFVEEEKMECQIFAKNISFYVSVTTTSMAWTWTYLLEHGNADIYLFLKYIKKTSHYACFVYALLNMSHVTYLHDYSPHSIM